MNLLIVFKVALRSLRRTLLRSILTMLGIIIGVGAVIALVGIGNGAKARVVAAASGPAATTLDLLARASRSQTRSNGDGTVLPGDGLTIEDYLAIRQRVPGFLAATPKAIATRVNNAAARGRTTTVVLAGIDTEGLLAFHRILLRGSGFGEADIRTAASVCIIPQSIATEFFANEDPLGQLIRMGGKPWIIIGVVTDDSSSLIGGFMPNASSRRDNGIMVPYTSIYRRIDRNPNLMLTLTVASPTELGSLQQAVLDLLEERRGNRKGEFVGLDVAQLLKGFSDTVNTMTTLLASIAGISLLVGGIGVMNIMLVAVTERTREIGIRLAIGTRGRDVLRQFVLEAVVLSVLGGLVGIVLGVGAAKLITKLNDWPMVITPAAVLGAFLTSAAIGVFFGWYPARKAAQLDPIEALRYE